MKHGIIWGMLWFSIICFSETIFTLDNKIYQGKIVSFQSTPKLQFTIQTKVQKKKILCEDIVKIICNKTIANLSSSHVVLNNGSKIYGKIVDGNPRFLAVESDLLGFFAVDLTKIKEIVFVDTPYKKESKDADNDFLAFKSGDTMSCLIERFGKGYVQVEHPQIGPRKEYFTKIAYIRFATLDVPEITNEFTANIVGLDNSSISGKIINFSNSSISFKIDYLDTQINIPVSKVKYLFFKNGRFVYLSDLPSSKYQMHYSSFFPLSPRVYEPKLDKNQKGESLQLNGQVFYKGIGVFSKTIIMIDLDKKYKRFQSYIGIDDHVRRKSNSTSHMVGGSVIFKVFVDGKEVYKSGIQRWFMPAKNVDIDISGKKQLKLLVDFAENGYADDLADWADARLVR